ncbi:50S ribosomal protein L27, partial [Francisella tularensis subsp. holarctica]|nr:50S ribosomal protein L27 [Francisella tularensis subsp. holarctica]
ALKDGTVKFPTGGALNRKFVSIEEE